MKRLNWVAWMGGRVEGDSRVALLVLPSPGQLGRTAAHKSMEMSLTAIGYAPSFG